MFYVYHTTYILISISYPLCLKVGMNMEFELGKFLKKRYIEHGFINQSYIAKEVHKSFYVS